MEIFRTLGNTIAREWRKSNYDEEGFRQIAHAALAGARLHDRVDADAIATWLVGMDGVPAQYPSDFGQPAIRVFDAHKFYIEILFWLESTTAIHQHAFSGAFGVIAGSSIHTQYEFTLRERLCQELLLGSLRYTSADYLSAGDTREIRAGSSYIHSLFHLDYPSISVVVRTYHERRHTPQYRYQAPGVAVDHVYAPQPFSTQLRLLESLIKIDRGLYRKHAAQIVRTFDLWTAFQVTMTAQLRIKDSDEAAELLRCLRDRHEGLADAVERSAFETARELDIVARRAHIKDPEHRFFLALLLNAPDRRALFGLVKERFPDRDPHASVMRWVRELASGADSGFITLGAGAIDLLSVAAGGGTFADVLSRYSTSVRGDQNAGALERAWLQLHAMPILRPLFSQSETVLVGTGSLRPASRP
jgi:hypothetical protein